MMFSKVKPRKKLTTKVLTEMNSGVLNFSTKLKYLGITFNHQSSWTPHTHNKVNKCQKLLMKCSPVVGHYFDPRPNLISWIFGLKG